MKFSKSYRSLYPSASPSKKSSKFNKKYKKATSITKLPKIVPSNETILTDSSNHIETSITAADLIKYRSEAVIPFKNNS